MTKPELKGALFFSKEHPQITGYLVIDGIEYEIAGWHASHIRADIEARQTNKGPRDKRPRERQLDLIDDTGLADGYGGASKGQRDQS